MLKQLNELDMHNIMHEHDIIIYICELKLNCVCVCM
jgi:hypothetical protein